MKNTVTTTGPYGQLEGASTQLAQFASATRYEQLPAEVIHATKRALLDYLACAIAGSSMPVSAALRAFFEEDDLSRHAAVVGQRTRLSAGNAAFLNGSHAHGLDFDDGNTQGSAHPGGAIFPAVLAAAERHGAGPKEIITAAVVGYDVMLRIAATMHPTTARKGWHNTAVAGVFGATAAVASILKLDARTTRDALGLAGSFAGGIREYLAEGAEIKRLHPGKAARDGLLCAEFARRGVTGPSRVLEGEMGLLRIVAGDAIRPQHLLEGLGQRYAIADTYFKPYPCCRHYHAAIDAVRALRDEHKFRPEDIESVAIGLYSVGVLGHDHTAVDTLLEAQMSAPCAVALAIMDGDVTAPGFMPQSLERPEVASLMRRTTTRLDAECEGIYPEIRSGVVRLVLTNGSTLERRVLRPKGEKDNPMSDADLAHKFRSNCEPLLGVARTDALLDAVRDFDRLPDASILFQW